MFLRCVIKMEKEYNIKILKKIGLTEYESKAYLSLIHLVSDKADNISKESNIPRSKIYPVLENLEKKKLIKINEGRPLIYEVITPSEAFTSYKNNLVDEINTLETNLINIYENKLPKIKTPILSIEDKKKILQKQEDIIKRSKNTLCIRLGFILPQEVEKFKKNINELIKKEVNVKILSVKKCEVNGKYIDMEEILDQLPVHVIYVNLPAAQLIIRDYKEMILTFADNSGESISEESMVALYNTYSAIITNYSVSFNKQWNKLSI